MQVFQQPFTIVSVLSNSYSRGVHISMQVHSDINTCMYHIKIIIMTKAVAICTSIVGIKALMQSV